MNELRDSVCKKLDLFYIGTTSLRSNEIPIFLKPLWNFLLSDNHLVSRIEFSGDFIIRDLLVDAHTSSNRAVDEQASCFIEAGFGGRFFWRHFVVRLDNWVLFFGDWISGDFNSNRHLEPHSRCGFICPIVHSMVFDSSR